MPVSLVQGKISTFDRFEGYARMLARLHEEVQVLRTQVADVDDFDKRYTTYMAAVVEQIEHLDTEDHLYYDGLISSVQAFNAAERKALGEAGSVLFAPDRPMLMLVP